MLQQVFGKSKGGEVTNSHLTPKVLNKAQEAEKLASQIQAQRFSNRLVAFSSQYPRAKLFFAGIGIGTLLYGANQSSKARENKVATETRKERMAKPTIQLTGADSQNPPFTEKNINDWLYKTVSITGRPIHGKGMMIPAKSYGLHGFEYLVPFVTKENEDGSVQEGLILNLGFIPREYAPIWARARVENVEEQTFTCVVTDGKHLSEQGGLFASNKPCENQWEYADLDQLAKHTGFVNQEQVRSCILEHVNTETPNDERDCRHIDICSDYKEDYPYKFTRSGVLQQPGQMYWDLNKSASYYSLLGLGCSVFSALLFLAK
ncbi:SURF1 family protein (macronuclear) [Tetrahymena thermophila SB210]|uniref:SURF1-like protein n=1 Tax=Tetrahymena thermophila (strain SB210) TaxID=312017 RepID=I7LTZ4_TETTS|nr:SURF1 family protein [Tetrahymena thermophila SB210]7W5Z_H Chain H, SURF1-like protein [Tetrahymena thermophila]7W5Z_h Chain h, SURF1-like protein [Tetrahymena thermophila]8B6H_DW Chain DW, SURF1-like protein [Tetrahymena thermophila SB210]8B6H_Dw Chain Dw, SURF1-like protein [Tetrahymena thermophila SB210]8BQS_DW Chain DW, SURF1-like protein [Tetrahymena thermophila SB210]8BQS_Dw Chain Dw, SURF1-like protein [Tetrahymena thermophila SB210]8GYM_H Chain H, SURF1-like protein [Tetrahymena t|eukprot:XP_001007823.2 SURF1 family protein [Tetrahymena thermophila SB210]